MFGTILCTSCIVSLAFLNRNKPRISGRHKPDINFHGTLTDRQGNTFFLNNITIYGRYRQIPFYIKPLSSSIDPTNNRENIDLAEIKSIKVLQPLTIKKRKYVEVEITHNDNMKDRYIIEASRLIMGDRTTQDGPIEKDIAMEKIISLTISHYTEPENNNSENEN